MSAIWPDDSEHIEKAATRLRQGGLVAVPTETVYGLAADAANGQAVASIYDTKGRPSFNPLIAHVRDKTEAARLGVLYEQAERLIEAFWPGPLTLVVPKVPNAPVSELVTAGLETIALRSPAHPVARQLLAQFGHPFVAPSANRSGRISPTHAAHVRAEFDDIPVLDGGACQLGLESTILGLSTDQPTLLRPGTLTIDEITKTTGVEITRPSGSAIQAPGMMSSHYAPHAAVRLQADHARPGEVLLGFGGTDGATLDLSPEGDLKEAAAHLFDYLRQLDAMNAPIAIAPIPEHGLGVAINDRLRRAAAPRD